MKPLVPSNPGPPKDPKSFWAPWPAISDPCTKRTINGADSLTFEVFILSPSLAFSALTRTLAHDLYPGPPGLHSCLYASQRCLAGDSAMVYPAWNMRLRD